MAEFNGISRMNTSDHHTPTPTSPTFEQLLPGDTSRFPASSTASFSGKDHDHEDQYDGHHNKKSVLTKVKEKAMKFRSSLSSKKQHEQEDSRSPSWAVTLDEEEEEEDPEYLGAPMYESELAPETCKEYARQHPRADPVVSDNHLLATIVKRKEEETENPLSPSKTITETVSRKLAPAYSAVAEATHTVASRIAGLTFATPDGGNCAGGGMQSPGQVSETREHVTGGGISRKMVTDKVSPARTADDMGRVDKVKEAVTSLLYNEEPSQRATNLSSSIPISANPQPVTKEESHGRVLQSN